MVARDIVSVFAPVRTVQSGGRIYRRNHPLVVMALAVLPIVFLSAEEAMIPKNFAAGGGSHGVSLLPRVRYAATRPSHSIA